jgi:hypothetical protein
MSSYFETTRFTGAREPESPSVPADSAFLRAKQTVTVTIEFCNWLDAQHNTTADRVTQAE